jgi:hypothetical protein
LHSFVTHRFSLECTAEAFALNAQYGNNVVKVLVDCSSGHPVRA